MAVRTAYDPTAGEVLTATNLERLAGGWIGYAEVTANQSGIGSTVTDLTGLSVAVTVGPSRRIRISARVLVTGTVADTVAALLIREGGTTLTQGRCHIIGSTSANGLTSEVVLTPSTGAHTYKLSAQWAAGSGTITIEAAAGYPAFVLVEDIGPAA